MFGMQLDKGKVVFADIVAFYQVPGGWDHLTTKSQECRL